MGWEFEEDHMSQNMQLEWKVIHCDCHSGDSYAINPCDMILSQKNWQSWGEKREEEDEEEALEYVFKYSIKRKKYWIFNSWPQLGLWQVWWCAECLPKCSGAQGKGLQSRIPLFPFFLKWKAEGEEASSMAVSYETVTISLHDHRRAKYICFMHIILSGKAREYKKENMVFFSAARCWSASKILMFINR